MCKSKDDFVANVNYGGTTFCKIQGQCIEAAFCKRLYIERRLII